MGKVHEFTKIPSLTGQSKFPVAQRADDEDPADFHCVLQQIADWLVNAGFQTSQTAPPASAILFSDDEGEFTSEDVEGALFELLGLIGSAPSNPSVGEQRVTLLTDDQKARMTLRYVGSFAPTFSQSGAKDYTLTVPAGTRLNAWQFHAIEAATVTNGGNFNLAITDDAGNVNTGLYDILDTAGLPINRTAYGIGVDISYTAGTMSLQFTNVGGTGAFKIPFTVCG